jgi:hypothetical protein
MLPKADLIISVEGVPTSNVGSGVSGAVDTVIVGASGASYLPTTTDIVLVEQVGTSLTDGQASTLPPVDLPQQTPRFIIDGVVEGVQSLKDEVVIGVKNFLSTVADNAPLDTSSVDPQQGL